MNLCKWENANPADVFRCTVCGAEIPRADIPALPYRRQCSVRNAQQVAVSPFRVLLNAIQNAGTILFGSNAHKSQITRRREICGQCEFSTGSETCGLCGCGLTRKQSKRSAWCPILKWDGDVERFGNETQNGTVAVGISTCPRSEPTLDATRQSLKDGGFRWHTLIEDKNRDGAWNTFRRGLAQLIASYPNASAYLMFQDDVQVAKGLADYLPTILWPDDHTGVVSIYCCGMYQFDSPGLHEHGGTTWGALALCFTPLSARLFVKTTTMRQRGAARIDKKVSEWCAKHGLSYWLHWPSLIQHTGRTSTISGERLCHTRRAREFCEDCANLSAELPADQQA